jgi:hypothetical protein
MTLTRPVRCKYCKRSGFTWVEREYRWQLMEADGTIHECRVTPSYKPSTYRRKAKRR